MDVVAVVVELWSIDGWKVSRIGQNDHAKKSQKLSGLFLVATQQSQVTIQRQKEKGKLLKGTGSTVRSLTEERLVASQVWGISPPR